MTNILSFLLATLFLWLSYTFLWPWLGPQLFTPCPLYTAKGALLLAGWHAFFNELLQWGRDQRYVRK